MGHAARLLALIAFACGLTFLSVACGFPQYGGFDSSGAGGHGGAGTTAASSGSGTSDAGGGCGSDDDCKDSPIGPKCETSTGTCVVCLPSEDKCGTGLYCAPNFTCQVGCHQDSDCNAIGSGGQLTCDTNSHVCLGCTVDDQCPLGTICDVGTTACVPGCTPTHDCQGTDKCCAGTCSDPLTDTNNCGACGQPCAPANGTGLCVAGKCTLGGCNPGHSDCDKDSSNGCESDDSSNATNCGGCGKACTGKANAEPACVNGSCGLGACLPNFGNCDGNDANGCEANLLTDPKNCNGCGNACSTNNGTATCSGGTCGINCTTGFKDCDNDVTNGCEVDTSNNVNNCNGCGNVCPPQGGTPACLNSVCGVSSCLAGKADCDANPGCETNTTNDPNNCNGCGLACSVQHATTGCSGSACFIQTCDNGFKDCNGTYTDGCETNIGGSDVSNCGNCNVQCTNGHGTTSCSSGTCAPLCSGSFKDCDGNPTNGCETDTNNDDNNCGVCGKTCTFAHGVGSCQGGACVLTSCNVGFKDCDGNQTNGCEVNLNDPSTCGGCTTSCTNAHGSTTCSGGVCVPSCSAGFKDCNSNPNDGCETNINTDTANCGACGTPCSSANGVAACGPPNAANGVCSIACTAPFKDCDGNPRSNGCEANTNSDPLHCGASCSVCSAPTPNCSGGACVPLPCNPGTSNCDGNNNTGTNGCECSTPSCCGASCADTHITGMGQNFYDCTAPSTYNATEALAACVAYTGNAALCVDYGSQTDCCKTVGGTCSFSCPHSGCASSTQSLLCTTVGDVSKPYVCWTYAASVGFRLGNVVADANGASYIPCDTVADGHWQ